MISPYFRQLTRVERDSIVRNFLTGVGSNEFNKLNETWWQLFRPNGQFLSPEDCLLHRIRRRIKSGECNSGNRWKWPFSDLTELVVSKKSPLTVYAKWSTFEMCASVMVCNASQ